MKSTTRKSLPSGSSGLTLSNLGSSFSWAQIVLVPTWLIKAQVKAKVLAPSPPPTTHTRVMVMSVGLMDVFHATAELGMVRMILRRHF